MYRWLKNSSLSKVWWVDEEGVVPGAGGGVSRQ